MRTKINAKFMLGTIFIMLIILSGVSCGKNVTTTAPTERIYNLRDTGPAGGLIFYDKGSYSDGWRYLEAWIADESSTYAWKTSTDSSPGTSTAIGIGYANTYTHMSGANHPAAEVVRNATHGGKSDWFLPSKGELYEMCWILHSRKWNGSSEEDNPAYGANRVGFFVDAHYWSSSESSANLAWLQGFSNGYQTYSISGNLRRVRAVRAF